MSIVHYFSFCPNPLNSLNLLTSVYSLMFLALVVFSSLISVITARCYAERGCASSVRPFRYRDHIGWNTSTIISRPNIVRSLLTFSPTSAIWSNENTPKLEWNKDGVMSTKTCNISETVQDRTRVTMTD